MLRCKFTRYNDSPILEALVELPLPLFDNSFQVLHQFNTNYICISMSGWGITSFKFDFSFRSDSTTTIGKPIL